MIGELINSFEDFSNSVDEELSGIELFKIIDVMKSGELWKTFLNDLYDKIQTWDDNYYLAIQPGWILMEDELSSFSSSYSNKNVARSSKSIRNLRWHGGPAGGLCKGGDLICLERKSNLYVLSGIALSSKFLDPNVVFWIDFMNPHPSMYVCMYVLTKQNLLFFYRVFLIILFCE